MSGSYLTAMTRSKPSAPAVHAYTNIIVPRKFNSVLDWGSGKGRDVIFFRENKLRVAGYDPYYNPTKPKLSPKYDCVMCTYVLNTIKTKRRRVDCLREARKYLRRDGRMVISARSKVSLDKEVKDSWSLCGDGWITGRETFQHGFDIAELVEVAKAASLTPITCFCISSGGVLLVAGK